MEKKGKDVKITPELIMILKKPLGEFIKGSEDETSIKVKNHFSILDENTQPPVIISVGDVCTRSLFNNGIKLDVAIIDGKTLRTSEEIVNFPTKIILKLTNKKGYIEAAAWQVVKKAIDSEKKPVLIQVDGEEDLLTIIAVLEAPLNSIVFYGQPPIESYCMDQGLVLITVTPKKKDEFIGYLEKMELIN